MIDVREHVYDDDPKAGHPDVRTFLKDVAYFFLGNGHVLAAVQSAPSGEGTPLGLLIQSPDRLGRKRDALTMDPERGLETTAIVIEAGGAEYRPADPDVRWIAAPGLPKVAAEWIAGALKVREIFSCPRLSEPVVARDIAVSNEGASAVTLRLRTGSDRHAETIVLPPAGEARRVFLYRLEPDRTSVAVEVLEAPPDASDAEAAWRSATRLRFDDPLLDHLFQTCARQLPAVISKSGRVDASIWQYGREWVRDHSYMAEGLTLLGRHDAAGALLGRLLADFVAADGDCLDSSERRAPEDAELDQNGVLLQAVENHALWSGDRSIVSEHWDKIRKTAEYPLRPEFRHASGLLRNRRDYWERHAAYGIEDGIELMYQVGPAMGLRSAARMARWVGNVDEAERWERESSRLREAALGHPGFRMIDERGFIKRRRSDGPIQATIDPRPDSGLPPGVPLASPMTHFLRPDASTALPIALGFIPPDDPAVPATLDDLEALWNQNWTSGGYGRYHYSSEPDSPGPWPFASLIIARAALEAGRADVTWRVLRWLGSLPCARSGSWFEMLGERLSPPYAQIGIVPWAWAEAAMLFIRHVLGLRVRDEGLVIRPRLLPGMGGVSGSLPFRGRRLEFEIRAGEAGEAPRFRVDGREAAAFSGTLIIPYAGRDIRLEAVIAAGSNPREWPAGGRPASEPFGS